MKSQSSTNSDVQCSKIFKDKHHQPTKKVQTTQTKNRKTTLIVSCIRSFSSSSCRSVFPSPLLSEADMERLKWVACPWGWQGGRAGSRRGEEEQQLSDGTVGTMIIWGNDCGNCTLWRAVAGATDLLGIYGIVMLFQFALDKGPSSGFYPVSRKADSRMTSNGKNVFMHLV